QLRSFGELPDHVAQTALGVEVRMRVRNRVHDNRAAPELLDLETDSGEERSQLLHQIQLRPAQADREREQEPLTFAVGGLLSAPILRRAPGSCRADSARRRSTDAGSEPSAR